MNLFRSLAIEETSLDDAPPSLVMKLAPGEREVASLVYRLGSCTAKDIQSRLAKPLANATVRSMLRRLVQKGIIAQRPGGTYRTYLYLPAITNEYVRQRALMRLAQDHFEGSLPNMIATLVHLMDVQSPATPRRAARH
jgi:predicted transcriptional regulator